VAIAQIRLNPMVTTGKKKAIEAIGQDGMKKIEVSQLFNISRNTINLCLKRQAETGDFQALSNQPPGNQHKI
jgi:transposase